MNVRVILVTLPTVQIVLKSMRVPPVPATVMLVVCPRVPVPSIVIVILAIKETVSSVPPSSMPPTTRPTP